MIHDCNEFLRVGSIFVDSSGIERQEVYCEECDKIIGSLITESGMIAHRDVIDELYENEIL